jgi:hypothetical protein
MAEGWHDVQMPAGHGGCPALGHGTFTLYVRGVSGGSEDAAEAVAFGVILRKYA